MTRIFLTFSLLGFVLLSAFTLPDNEIPLDPDTGMASYKEVITVSGVSADDLYRGIAWVNKFYVNPTGVLKTQDKATGEFSGKARFKLQAPDKKGNLQNTGGFVAYQITIQAKEGKCRYIIDRIRWEQPSYYDVSKWSDSTQSNYNKELFTSYITQTAQYFDDLTENLENYMKVGEAEKKDEWCWWKCCFQTVQITQADNFSCSSRHYQFHCSLGTRHWYCLCIFVGS